MMTAKRELKEKFLPYHIFVAKNDTPIHIRPIQRDDTAYLIDIFDNMSTQSRYRRFNQYMDHISERRKWDIATTIANADPLTNFGLMAFADLPDGPDPPIGAARYVKITDTQAEIAISLVDEYQGIGIGSYLLRQLTEYAAADGIETLVAGIQNANEPIWSIIRKLPYEVVRYVAGDSSNIEIDITKPISHK